MSSLGGSLGGLGLLHTSDGGLGGNTAVVAATASILTAAADEVVERLVQVGRHSEDLWVTGWQSWQFAIRREVAIRTRRWLGSHWRATAFNKRN